MKILFVCLGNICRSPAASGVFDAMIAKKKLSDKIQSDSCGTGNWHIGRLPDERMVAAGARRGYNFTHRARRICTEDYYIFDLILAMDEYNFIDVLEDAPEGISLNRIRHFGEFCSGRFENIQSVPDPYIGGIERDFEFALDMIENGCDGLVTALKLRGVW